MMEMAKRNLYYYEMGLKMIISNCKYFNCLMSEVNMDEETEKKLNEIFHSIKLEYD